MKILILESDPGDVELLSIYLMSSNLSISELTYFTDLTNGIGILDEFKPDVILYDLSLLDESGLEGFNRLKRSSNAPIIVLSGNNNKPAMKLISMGAQDYLYKDLITSDLLERTIDFVIEKNQLKLQVIEEQGRFLTLFENSPIAIVFLDKNGIISDINKRFSALLGYKEGEIVGKSIFDLTYPEDLSKSKIFFEKLNRHPELSYTFEKRYLTKMNGPKWVQITVFTIELPVSNDIMVVDFIRDISDFKSQEMKLKQQEKELEEAQKIEAFSLLAGGVAHDYNNILTTISGYTQLALGNLSGNPKIQKYLNKILDSVDRAAILTDSLSLPTRNFSLEKSKVNINSLLLSSKLMIKSLGSHIDVIYELTEQDTTVFANRSKIENIILNLVVNSKDAIANTGRITLRTSVMTRNEMDFDSTIMEKEYVKITIEDNGIGMNQETVDNVFNPFFTTKSKGTGLGLTNVKRILDDYNGFIKVNSTLGKGTEIAIYFPKYLGSEFSQYESNEVNDLDDFVDLSGKTIMLAEDNEDVLNLLGEFITRTGGKVLLAENGEIALDVFISNYENLDLIITDLQMPKLSGNEFLSLIQHKSEDIPILIITGNKRGIENEFGNTVNLLRKPFQMNEFLLKIKEIL